MATIISTKTSGVGGLSVTGDASGILQLASADGTTALTINASQNVGIGTSSPTNISGNGDLTVLNRVFAGVANASYPSYSFIGRTDSGMWSPSASTIAFSTGFTERMRIDASGNVGIGTSSPSAKLDVSTSINLGLSYLNVAYDIGGGAGWLGGYNVTYTAGVKNIATGSLSAASYQSGGVVFYTNTSSAAGTVASERMRIDSSGNVGIGTSSPAVKLDVTGSQYIRWGNFDALTINGSSTNSVGLRIQNTVASGRNWNIGSSGGGVGAAGSFFIFDDTAGAGRLIIDSSGTLILNQGQIKFPSTQVASSDVNTLDDYEEGSWTPTVTSSSGAITSYTAFGYYTKIGRIVSAQFHISITNIGTAAGTYLNVASIPFTGNGGMTFQGTYRENAVNGFMGQVSLGTSQFSLLRYDNAGVAVAGGVYIGNITYHV